MQRRYTFAIQGGHREWLVKVIRAINAAGLYHAATSPHGDYYHVLVRSDDLLLERDVALKRINAKRPGVELSVVDDPRDAMHAAACLIEHYTVQRHEAERQYLAMNGWVPTTLCSIAFYEGMVGGEKVMLDRETALTFLKLKQREDWE